ncbi:hypothetical protein [Mesorhizobium abyssinicae]|uniref:hypothetical protein n=1 Tax=Mesorhizobium abyssinicae TaxID=1209958 RepID=UPI003CEA1D5B
MLNATHQDIQDTDARCLGRAVSLGSGDHLHRNRLLGGRRDARHGGNIFAVPSAYALFFVSRMAFEAETDPANQ